MSKKKILHHDLITIPLSTLITPAFSIKKISFQKKKLQSSRKNTEKKLDREQRGTTPEGLFLIIYTPLDLLSVRVHHPQVPTIEMIKNYGGEVATGHSVGNPVAAYPTE